MDVLCVGQLAADILVRPVDRVDFGVDTMRVDGIDIKKIVVASSQAVYGEGKYECAQHAHQRHLPFDGAAPQFGGAKDQDASGGGAHDASDSGGKQRIGHVHGGMLASSRWIRTRPHGGEVIRISGKYYSSGR